jgi:ribonucleoside-diphosphate reductase alpha chain
MPLNQFSKFADDIRKQKYSHTINGSMETWAQTSARVASNVLGAIHASDGLIKEISWLIEQRKFLPGGRQLYSAGRPFHNINNCFLLRAEDSREGWAELMYKSAMCLMVGGGIGVDYSDVRPEGSIIGRTGGFATGPLSLMAILNEQGRGIMQGGSRRSAIWAGLRWDHADVHKFIQIKNWTKDVRAMKAKDYNFPATLDGTNVSVQLNDAFFAAYKNHEDPKHTLAHSVYWAVIERMLKTGEPGFSVDCGDNTNETLRNACTELTSSDDSDVCCIGSINMARIHSLEEMEHVTRMGTIFLLAATVYSDTPYDKVKIVRDKNRRLGLGLMGLHEWLLRRGKSYGPDNELEKYLDVYKSVSRNTADFNADLLGISRPVKVRAIAPNGTISIIGQTTSGCEALFCAAYKRRYLKGSVWNYQYVIDPIAKSLVDSGANPDTIEDCYSISPQRRVEFQVWLQKYIDHGISSTINLPSWGSEENNEDTVRPFGEMLIKSLPNLRGITCYPDGSRSGQPLQTVSYKTAIRHVGDVFQEQGDICDIRGGGSCGA